MHIMFKGAANFFLNHPQLFCRIVVINNCSKTCQLHPNPWLENKCNVWDGTAKHQNSANMLTIKVVVADMGSDIAWKARWCDNGQLDKALCNSVGNNVLRYMIMCDSTYLHCFTYLSFQKVLDVWGCTIQNNHTVGNLYRANFRGCIKNRFLPVKFLQGT